MLKKGTVMPMWDIKDKLPERSFLPRSISSKLPFSTSKISELKRVFHAGDNSPMETMLVETLTDCEKAPSLGETKRCVGSAEDMIDFAISVLGSRNVAIRTTKNAEYNDRVLLLDKPTSALDPISTENIEDVLVNLKKKQGMTIIMVSHSIKQIQRIADIVCLLVKGEIVEVLRPDKLSKAKHPMALRFLQLSS
nr:polygalacturonase-1 non-catalytic subunit beta-like [Quercus suber]